MPSSHNPCANPTDNQFDQPIDRRRTSSQKWDKYREHDILPMWVADTDFRSPAVITDALQQRVEHGVFGYTLPPTELNEVVIERLQRLYDWQIEPDWLVWLPGLVCGLHLACRSVGESGNSVIAPKPIYPPFMTSPRLSDRCLITVPMTQTHDKRWLIDFDALEAAIDKQTKLILFCNPHNPGGSVYRRDELERLIELCQQHDLVLCSDEIHCDLLLEPGIKHIPAASLSPEAAARTITLMAPSKTFNIAGLGCSLAIIPDPQLRRAYQQVRRGIVPDANLLGFTATLAAYRDGDDWNRQQCDYLRGNRDLLLREINAIDGLKLDPFEATYLAWIDVSALELDNPPAFFEAAGVGMSPGVDFGDANFMRMNFGCTRSTVEQAIERIRRAIEQR